MAAKKRKRPAGVQYPSETVAARAARGRLQVLVTMSPEERDACDELAARLGTDRSKAIVRAVASALASTPPRAE